MIRAAAEQVLVEYKTQTDKTLATSKEAIRATADELKEDLSAAAALAISVTFGYGRYAGYTQGYTEGWREAVVRVDNQDVESGAQR
jgi:hypothetical protein